MKGDFMGFTNVFGLIGLVGIPIIILLYMLRPKNKPLNIPSLYLWQSLKEEIESASKLKKLKSSILMVLQIIIVLLLSIILADVYIRDNNASEKVLIVVDCSYTMASSDVEGNRLALAKKLADQYIDGLNEGTAMSLMVLEDVPRMILTNETDGTLVKKAIEDLQVMDGLGDLSIAKETIELVREEGQEVIYFGDRRLAGAIVYSTLKDTKNYSVHQLSYTKYDELGTISVLTEVFNQDDKEAIIPLSLYIDGQFFGAKQLVIEAKSSGKVFFEDIPLSAHELMIELDVSDNLEIDNKAYGLVTQEKMKKALLVTPSNVFLEKIIRLHPNIELFVASTSDTQEGDSLKFQSTYSGYELYIFDRSFPEEFPTDGNLILIDPVDVEEIPTVGYVENPKFSTNNHEVTRHIEATEFSVRIASVFKDINPRDIIYMTEFGPTAYSTEMNEVKTVVFGFDLHDTDLPLSLEFPVLMMNTLDYLIQNSLVENTNLVTGDSVMISILPSATEAFVTLPDGKKQPLSTLKRDAVFTDANQVGTYLVEEVTPTGSVFDEFTINVPKLMETTETLDPSTDGADQFLAKKLGYIFGYIVVIVILSEWFIYSVRRKIYGNTF